MIEPANNQLISISEAAKMLGVSVDTLRRWDKAGKLQSIRLSSTGHRYYNLEDLKIFSRNIFSLAQNWTLTKEPHEPDKKFYCADATRFQSKLIKLESELHKINDLKESFSLISAIAGEIGNNSFDHNIGSWPDIRGIFFAYDINKKQIALADRGQGILKTLRRVRPELTTDEEALRLAFTEKVSGRSPESRGNGLKFVRKIITEEKSIQINLYFQTGEAELTLKAGDEILKITKTKKSFRGCLALISF